MASDDLGLFSPSHQNQILCYISHRIYKPTYLLKSDGAWTTYTGDHIVWDEHWKDFTLDPVNKKNG